MNNSADMANKKSGLCLSRPPHTAGAAEKQSRALPGAGSAAGRLKGYDCIHYFILSPESRGAAVRAAEGEAAGGLRICAIFQKTDMPGAWRSNAALLICL